MKLETKRLILRDFTIDDLNDFALLMADPEVMRFSLNGPMQDKEQARGYLQKRILDHYIQYGYGLYAVIHKTDNCLIGLIGLINQIIDGMNKTELGYRLNPNYWGQGLASEAALAICHYAFEELGKDELISIIDPKNFRSLETAKRIGMHYWKEAVFHDIPVHIYALKRTSLKAITQNTKKIPSEGNGLINANKNSESFFRFRFKLVEKKERSLVHAWLGQSYVNEWFYGQGLENTFKYLDEFFEGSPFSQYWLALEEGHPFAFLITSSVNKPEDELTKWCLKEGNAITLDMLIGDINYLGKGYAVQVIQEFLLTQFPNVDEVLIDPEASNLKAVHVYQKAGFQKVGEFIPSHSPHLHHMMKLNLRNLKQLMREKNQEN